MENETIINDIKADMFDSLVGSAMQDDCDDEWVVVKLLVFNDALDIFRNHMGDMP